MKIRAAGYATTGGRDVLRMVDLPYANRAQVRSG